MPYRVTPTGEILCDTAEEAIALSRALAGQEVPNSTKKETRVQTDRGSRWTEGRYKEFMSYVKGDQQQFLSLLLQTPDGMIDSSIRRSLGMKSNLQLAGVTAGLVKNAKKAGILSGEEIFTKEVTHHGDERVLEYKLADSFRAIAENIGLKE